MTVKLSSESFPLQLTKPVSHSQKLLPRYNLQAKITLQFKCIHLNNLKCLFITSEKTVLKYLHLILSGNAPSPAWSPLK